MADVKRTQRDYLVALRGMVEGMDVVGEVPANEILEFIDKKIAQADAKSVKAKEKAAEKKSAGDTLRAEIEALITDEWKTGDQITAELGKEDVTKPMVVNRLGQLVKAEVVIKEVRKVGDRKVMCYAVAGTPTDVE